VSRVASPGLGPGLACLSCLSVCLSVCLSCPVLPCLAAAFLSVRDCQPFCTVNPGLFKLACLHASCLSVLIVVFLSVYPSNHPSIFLICLVCNDEQPASGIEPLRKIKIEGKNEQRMNSVRPCVASFLVPFLFVCSFALSLSFFYLSLF
jgi:hypothetical protein